MKNSHLLLSFVSLSLTVISARAASLEINSECVQLPAYTVEVPRHSAAERQIARNLQELREAARTPLSVKPEIPLFSRRNVTSKDALKPAPVLVVAKS